MELSEQSVGTGWQVYKRLLFGYTLRYIGVFLLSVLGYIIYSATQVALAEFMKYIIEAVESHDPSMRVMAPVFFVVLAAVRGVGFFMGAYFLGYVGRNIVFDMRNQMFAKLMDLPQSFYHQHASGHIISRLTFNVQQVTSAATDAFRTIVREGFTVIGLLGYLLYQNWRLTLMFLLIGPILGWVVSKAGRRFRSVSERIQHSMGDLTHVLTEAVSAYPVVKLYGGESYERERFQQANRYNMRQQLKLVVVSSLNTPLVQLILAAFLGAFMYMALSPLVNTASSAGEFVAFITAATMMAKPIRQLTDVNSKIQQGIAASHSVFELLDSPSEADEGAHVATTVQGRIEFQQVRFQYPNAENEAIQDVTLTIEPGQTVALVGRSGSGKSTLSQLVPRFLVPTDGRVLIDGMDVQDYTLESLRKQIALVDQKVVLFNDSVAHNVAYGSLEDSLSPQQLQTTLENAHAWEFVSKMDQGVQSPVGQDGVQLSGGQRQRIAIARALAKDAPILILDEATSALDNESERLIQDALNRVAEGRTTLVIAHRLSTIENADVIVVMEDGRIVEQGSHEALINQGGAYAAFHQSQTEEGAAEKSRSGDQQPGASSLD